MRDVWRPGGGASRLTYRRLAALIDGLPGESAYKTAVRDSYSDEELAKLAAEPRDGHGAWSHTDMRLANIEDLLRWVIFAVFRSSGFKADEPEPTPRPGVIARRKTRHLGAAQRAYLQRLREQHVALHGDTSGALKAG